MLKTIHLFFLLIFVLQSVNANNNLLYQYKITIKENSISKIEEVKNYIKIFAHTNDIEFIENGKIFIINTIYKINENSFIGKLEKNNLYIETILLKSQTTISEEARDKIEKTEKQKAIEWNKSGK